MFRIKIFLSLICLLAAACSQATNLPTRAERPAMKGMELYSWKTAQGEWQFALLLGTNRLKTMEEITAKPMALDQLQEAIGHLAIGEQMFWSGKQVNPKLVLPPDDIVTKIEKTAQKYGVKLAH